MSYSRWSNSRWYTYWHANSDYFRDDQSFSVDCAALFSYRELKDGLEDCLNKIKEICLDATFGELDELRGYMIEFMMDVESDKELDLIEACKTADVVKLEELRKSIMEDKELQKTDPHGAIYYKEETVQFVDELLKVMEAESRELPLLLNEVKIDFIKGRLLERLKVV